MDQPFAVGRTDVELTAAMERGEGVPDAGTPFRILLIGDVSGRANRGLVSRAGPRARSARSTLTASHRFRFRRPLWSRAASRTRSS